jgi:hypothetical protein
MKTPHETTQIPERQNPASTLRTIINWIVETDRRFRMTQDQIDRLTDRF